MAMIVLRRKLPEQEIMEDYRKLREKLPKWFEEHPERVDCIIQLPDGSNFSISKEHWERDVAKALELTLASEK